LVTLTNIASGTGLGHYGEIPDYNLLKIKNTRELNSTEKGFALFFPLLIYS